MQALQFTCHRCGRPNEIIATAVPDDAAVSCSHCGEPFGLWGDRSDHADSRANVSRYRKQAA